MAGMNCYIHLYIWISRKSTGMRGKVSSGKPDLCEYPQCSLSYPASDRGSAAPPTQVHQGETLEPQ